MNPEIVFTVGYFLGGTIVYLLIRVPRKVREVDEVEYLPLEAQNLLRKMRKNDKGPFFAEPVEPEDAFKKAKDVDDFISKIK